MSYSGDININNSFEITLKNNTSVKQRFAMFELGSDDANAITLKNDIVSATPNTIYPNGFDLGSNTALTINPTNNEVRINFDFQIQVGINASVNTVTGLGNSTLQEVVDTFNETIALVPSAKYLRINLAPRIILGRLSTRFLQFSATYLEANPDDPSDTAGYFTGDPNDSSNGMLLDYISFQGWVGVSPPPVTSFASINLFPAKVTQTTNNGAIEVVATSGTPYNQILESQNGQVLDIKSMRIDALPSIPTQGGLDTFIDAQLLTPLKFIKNDAKGDDLEYHKIPTIDPYQFQKSIDFINMETKADTFALDGTTKFVSEVQPYTSLRLSCEYTSITNFMADSSYAIAQEEKQAQTIEQRREDGDNARTYKAEIPIKVLEEIERDNKRFDDIEKKKKKSKVYLLYPKENFWRLVA